MISASFIIDTSSMLPLGAVIRITAVGLSIIALENFIYIASPIPLSGSRSTRAPTNFDISSLSVVMEFMSTKGRPFVSAYSAAVVPGSAMIVTLVQPLKEFAAIFVTLDGI